MANRKLPPCLYQRQYRTRGGYKRTLFYIRFKDHTGKRRTFPGIDNFAQACAELERLKALNRNRHDFDAKPAPPARGLYKWIDKFLYVKAQKKSAKRDKISAAWIKEFFGDCRLEDIVNSRMLEYRNSRLVAEGTKNRELAFLRGVLYLAHRDGALAKMPSIPFEEENNERIRTASPKEFAAIIETLAATRPDVRDVVVLLKETGFRVGEVLKLEARDLRISEQAIDMRRIRSKGGFTRLLPQSRVAWEILIGRAGTGKRLFHGLSSFMVWDYFKRACAANKIEGLWVHDIRGTFVTEKERARWPRKIIMEFTGHRSEKVFTRYSRPTDEDLRKFIGADAPLNTPLALLSTDFYRKRGNTAGRS